MFTTRDFSFAALLAGSALLLSASLSFPEVLLDAPSFRTALAGAHPVLATVGLLGLLAAGLLMLLRDGNRFGRAGGLCLAASALITPVSLWGNNVIAQTGFWSFTVAMLSLAAWTLTGDRRGVITVLAAVGLALVAARSVLWAVNAQLPAIDGFSVAAAILTVLALLGFPLWLCWLALSGVRSKLVAGLVGVVVVLAYAGTVTVTTPMPETDDVPAVPSAGGSAFYVMMLALSGQISPAADLPTLREQRKSDRYAKPENPAGATLERVDAQGVAADRICAPGSAKDKAVLYLHGGGFVMPVSNGHRQFAVTLSRLLSACVLLPNYRTAPEHPFPAPVEDTVHAYHYLRAQGIAAKRIVVLGDSCGGTFALSAALMLRESGEELPGALIALSGGFDITVSGKTHRTKAHSDAELGADDVRFSADSYTDGGRIDPRDPLVSPLFADVRGLPPTLLIAGTQDVLASDSPRMADRLRSAGVPVRLDMFPGLPHDFPLIVEEIMESGLALRHISTFVDRYVS
jgi:monoterpene epsilon-lactone hydrolase